jgi:hypothetical protein
LVVATGELAGWTLDNTGLYKVRSYTYDNGDIRTFNAGLNSEAFNVKLPEDIGFNLSPYTAGTYYQKITGPKNNIIENWEIPFLIDGKTVRKLETTFDQNRNGMQTWKSKWSNNSLKYVAFAPSAYGIDIDDYFFYYATNLS